MNGGASMFGAVRQRLPRWECKPLTDSARDRACSNCGVRDGTVVAAHGNESILGKGLGLKSFDVFVAFLCHRCHAYVDRALPCDATEVWGPTEDDRRECWRRAFFATLVVLALEGWIRPPGRA